MATRRSHTRSIAGLLVVGLFAAVLAACGSSADDVGDAEEAAGPPQVPSDTEPFDPDRSREQAESFLGVPEAEVEAAIADSGMARIVRRGDEQMAVTMDLRIGRLNIELDADDDGEYRVTRVVVETDDGPDIVVE